MWTLLSINAMPKLVDAVAQRKIICKAARRVFARRGVESAGLIHVAKLAGVGRATLYHYYPNKSSLVRDLVRELLSEEETLAAALRSDQDSPLRRIENFASELTELFGEWTSLSRMLFDLWSRTAAMFRPFFRRMRRHLAELIAEGQHSGEIDRQLEPDTTAAAVIALIDGLLLQRMLDADAFPEPSALGAHVVRAVRKMLVP
jgi:AcrR family transcriptional regulator